MEKTDEESKSYYASVVPVDMRVKTKPMFGSVASFINGNMFAGIFGRSVFARLPEEDRARLIREEGAAEFAPMPGRPMKEYVTLPDGWRIEPDRAREWLEKSLEWVETMPAKEPKTKTKAKK